MSTEPLQTAEGAEHAACQQLSVFLENQVGQLLRVLRLLATEPIRILGLSLEGKVDCAVLRLLVDDADTAHEICVGAGLAVAQSEILVVELPPGKRGLTTLCTGLLAGELSINYAYTVWATKASVPCLALQVDNLPQAVKVLALKKFRILAQHEL
ncbi:MAG: acetolactate synthase [Phycisphaerae bacterium]|jgi:hypothetical protein